MEVWRTVWRKGFAPILPTAGLEALAEALRVDDATLTQGATTTPPPLQCVLDWKCEGACGVAFALWKSGLETVGEIEDAFAQACYDADQLLQDVAGCRHFLNWFDDTPRDEMRRELLAEVKRTLSERTIAA